MDDKPLQAGCEAVRDAILGGAFGDADDASGVDILDFTCNVLSNRYDAELPEAIDPFSVLVGAAATKGIILAAIARGNEVR